MPQISAETITLIIAIWGALLSTLAIGWNLYRDLMDKGRLRVSCHMGMLVVQGVGVERDNCLFWTITNVGRQPVMLTHIGGHLNKKHFMLKERVGLPKMLQPGEYVTDYMETFTAVDFRELKALTAIDSLGRTYKAPRKQTRRVREEMSKIQAGSRK